MTRLMILGRGGIIDADRVVAITPVKSEPVKRMLDASDPAHVINMTYGYARGSVIIFENGYVAIVSQTVAELAQALKIEERISDAEDPVSW